MEEACSPAQVPQMRMRECRCSPDCGKWRRELRNGPPRACSLTLPAGGPMICEGAPRTVSDHLPAPEP